MTEKELKDYFYLKKEMQAVDRQIEELKALYPDYKAVIITSEPKSTKPRNPIEEYCIALAYLQKELLIQRCKLINMQLKIEKFLKTIEDAEIRLLFRVRHIDCLNWNEIADIFHLSESGARKKYYRAADKLVEKNKKCPTIPIENDL